MASESVPVGTTRLVRIFAEGAGVQEKCRATVIVVPDFETSAASSWQDGWNNCWLQTRLPAMLDDPRVLSFEPGLSCDAGFSWRHVIEAGDALLEQLLRQSEEDAEFRERPLFFLAHGLGGLILKRTLGVVFERFFDPVYRDIIKATSGIVLLGCPHPSVNRPRDLDRVALILKATRKQQSIKSTEGSAELAMIVANICQKFNDVGIESPVLSVYETKVSKIGRNIFSPRQILVDQHFCETLTRRERLLGAKCSHDELKNVNWKSIRGTTLDDELLQFFTLALDLRKACPVPSISSHRSIPKWTSPVTDLGDIPVRLERTTLVDSLGSPDLATIGSSEDDYIHISTQSAVSLDTQVPRARLPCYMYGGYERNHDFIGRHDTLQTIDEALLPSYESKNANCLKTFAICGIGGLGKTEVAAEFALSRKKEFDAIFWIHAGDNERLASDFAQIAINLGLVDQDKCKDQVVIRDIVLQWLAVSTERPHKSSSFPEWTRSTTVKWLLVFDNAESLSELRDYWPVSGTGSVLITSRDPLARTQTYFHSPKGVDLEPFTTEDSAAWLRKLTRHNRDVEDVELSQQIVEKLSNLPLAIPQVAGAIVRQEISFKEFLEYYEEEAFRAILYKSQYSVKRPVWTVFAFQQLSPQALALLNVICFFNPDAIPEELFTRRTGPPRLDVITVPDFPQTTMSYITARTELSRASLIRRNIDRKELKIHRIVQDSALCSLNTESLINAFETAIHLLDQLWPSPHGEDSDHSVKRLRQCEPLLPHILQLSTNYHMYQTLQEVNDYNNDLGRLIAEAGWYQGERGLWVESLPQQRLAQMLLENSPNPDNLLLAYVHFAQAEAGCNIDDKEKALSNAMQSLEYVKMVHVTKDTLTRIGPVYNQVGEGLVANKRYEEALPYYDEALAIYAQIPNRALYLNFIVFSYVGKAFSYWRKGGEGNITKASMLMEEVYTSRKHYFYNEDSLRTALILVELGNIRTVQERYDEALELHIEALNMYTAVYGRGYYRNAALLARIGLHYQRRGSLEAARDSFYEALSIYGNRAHYIAEITWTSFLYCSAVEALHDPTAGEARIGAEHELVELSLKIGRKIKEEELEHLLPPWAL